MSFDSIWDEITASSESNGVSPIFIVSWNDHFFILKVDSDAYYIIDTLGERLHEGCNQAYILKFDANTTICKQPSTSQSSEEKPDVNAQDVNAQPINSEEGTLVTVDTEAVVRDEQGQEEEVVCQGKESCKEYIKSFLAAIPIRELQADMRKGLSLSTPLHHRLQIEFHFTQAEKQSASSFLQWMS